MKIDGYKAPQSSFLAQEKDMGIIVNKILANNRLKKLLYYPTPDALQRRNLTEDESLSLFQKNVKIVPKLKVDSEELNYIYINFDNFVRTSNLEFRSNTIAFDIVCHVDSWKLQDFSLRPYRIAAELDTMLNNKHLTGIGKLEFMGAAIIVLNDEFAGLCLEYLTIHGGEDKFKMPNPADEEQFIKDFQDIKPVL